MFAGCGKIGPFSRQCAGFQFKVSKDLTKAHNKNFPCKPPSALASEAPPPHSVPPILLMLFSLLERTFHVDIQ